MLGQSLDQAKKTALGIEPGVSAELLLEGFQTLDDTGDAEVVVTLGTVEGTDD